nr:GGDEF domain-containing protein [Lachnospiraceae bacterium]
LFYVFGQYTQEFAKLYRILGKNDEAQHRLNHAIDFYDGQGCKGKADELRAVLKNKQYRIKKHKLSLSQNLRHEIDETLKHASVFKENQEQQKRMNFLSTWQKMLEIGDKNKKELINPALNAFVHNFNIDRLMLVKFSDSGPKELFNNTGYAFEGDRRQRIEYFFQRNRLGFATSKMNNNYTDYLELISLFNKSKVCSFIGMPFYYNDSLKAIMIAYIEMKENWHSLTNRYLLDEGDYAVFEFLMRQLLSSIDMLEANEKIKQMNDKLNHLAVTDKLTSLYNREGFYGNISSMVRRNKKAGRMLPITIMYIDLDNFKYYNDTFGHGVGDIILIGMAEIFQNEVGDSGFVTRYGGDEFLITLYTDDISHAEKLAKNIYNRIEQKDGFKAAVRNKLGKNINIPRAHQISCSIGISSRGTILSEDELEKMVKEADKVLYDVKKAGKGAYKFYE